MGQIWGALGDWSFTLLVLSVWFSKCLRHCKQVLLVSTAQGFLTDKMQISKTSSEPSALVRDLLSAVHVVGFRKKDDWCLLAGSATRVTPEKVRGPCQPEPTLPRASLCRVLVHAWPPTCLSSALALDCQLPHHCQVRIIKLYCTTTVHGFYFLVSYYGT